jgi:beta-1,4-mannosyltransferase
MSDPAVKRRVVIISRVRRNPYVSLLQQGLCQPDLHLEARVLDHFSVGWMWRNRRKVDVLHIHWLELLFVYPTLGRSLRRWLSVMAGLLVARLVGMTVAYTVHNIEHHEGQRATLTRWGNRVIMALAQAVHVHDAETALTLRRDWGRRRGIYIIPHGNYMTAYPNICSRAEARKRLGLDSAAFVDLCLGRVRPYKGIEELITAFKSLDGTDALLLIAGEVHDPGYDERLRALAQGDARIRFDLQFVADSELQVYLNACDLCILPYRQVTTSGAAILAFSFQVPIVAPRLGCFVELAGEDGARGILYDPVSPDGLLGALRQARHCDLAGMRAACAAYANRLNWNAIARCHAAMYAGYDRAI